MNVNHNDQEPPVKPGDADVILNSDGSCSIAHEQHQTAANWWYKKFAFDLPDGDEVEGGVEFAYGCAKTNEERVALIDYVVNRVRTVTSRILIHRLDGDDGRDHYDVVTDDMFKTCIQKCLERNGGGSSDGTPTPGGDDVQGTEEGSPESDAARVIPMPPPGEQPPVMEYWAPYPPDPHYGMIPHPYAPMPGQELPYGSPVPIQPSLMSPMRATDSDTLFQSPQSVGKGGKADGTAASGSRRKKGDAKSRSRGKGEVPSADGKGKLDPDTERRRRKNEQARLRAQERKKRLEKILTTPDKQRTEEDREILFDYEEKRRKKNERSIERSTEYKAKAERIANIPEDKRTKEEQEFLVVYFIRKKKKNDRDKERRVLAKSL